MPDIHMYSRVLDAVLQAGALDRISLIILQGLAIVVFLLAGVAAAHVLVRALRTEHGELRD